MPADTMDIDGGAPELPTSAATATATASGNSINLLRNGISIERRVKQELIDQGLLDPDDFAKDNEDEILSEIMRVRTELAAIAEHNHTELQKLQSAAKDEMKRLEIKRKLDSVDQEVGLYNLFYYFYSTFLLFSQIIEMYEKVVSIKNKRRALTEQEREEVFRLTEEQKRLSDQLDSMPAPGPNFSSAAQ